MKMLLLKLCMRSSITPDTEGNSLAAQVSASVCPPGISGCHHRLAVHIFSASADPMCAPGSQRRLLQRGRMASQGPMIAQPLSTLQEPGLSLTQAVGWGGSFCVVWMFVSDTRLPVRVLTTNLPYYTRDGEDSSDSQVHSGIRGGPAGWALGRRVSSEEVYK